MANVIAALARRRKLRVAGLMSGTSADGVSAAIADFSGRGIRLLAHGAFPYPPKLREEIFRLFRPETGRVDDICHMNYVLGEVFAASLALLAESNGIPMETIDLIGSHGQTIHHLPGGRRFGRGWVRSTLQIGEPCVIVERTGIATVADFRARDVAAGGQGAPLVPLADYILFHDRRRTRAIQNIGGIANVTHLSAGGRIADVRAFDTGPGNMMIDRAVRLATRGRASFDAGGEIAASGRVNARLLRKLMAHPFLKRRPPKTTGREEFGAHYTDRVYEAARSNGIPPRDIVATLTAFTARGIADAYRRFLGSPRLDEAILCGGGALNSTLVAMLRRELEPARLLLMDELGLPSEAKEALSFAILAVETLRGRPGNVPSATGARRPVVLGKIVTP